LVRHSKRAASAIELALNHLDDAELLERAAVLASLVEEGHATLESHGDHTILVAAPTPVLPPLSPALA
jgi:hypothetical protein